MTTTQEALAKLAAHCGIAAEYHDIWGKRHATSERTLHALLAAMHFPAEADPALLLRDIEEQDWRRQLPPVMVLAAGSPLAVPVTLPAARAGKPHRWLLTTEDGATRGGDFIPTELPRLGEENLDGALFLRGELSLPPLDSSGYHRLEIEQVGREGQAQAMMALIATPASCYQPEAVQGEGRVWGPTVQLYGLRSRRNWGIGDFSDLRAVVDLSATAGGGVVGVNPLHALFPDDPTRVSPYSPSSRCFVNILYLDVEAVPEYAECAVARNLVASERFQGRLRRLRASEQVAYEEVSTAKLEVLALLYHHFREQHLGNDSERARAFRRFRAEMGEALEQHARFEALQEHFRRESAAAWGWPAWPEAYRDPASAAVATFAAEHADRVEFFTWLQWLADEQLDALGEQSWRRGLGVGLYQDLAVGVNPGGSEAWAWQDAYAIGAHVGAPPDEFNHFGQEWGLPPLVPHRLREAAYAPFIAVLRANMRHCGALRIDHVMGLTRLFWVPGGLSPTEGAYVSYPLDDLLGILALESQRNRCLIIGEDLGTVPEGLRPLLATAGVLSYRPFLFESDAAGGFSSPTAYPRQALVAVSTHDLPTLAGFWKGSDLDTRAALRLFSDPDQYGPLVVNRAQDRARFLVALEREGLLPEGASIHPNTAPEMTPALMVAIHAYLARTPAQILVVQPEDILGLVEQVNLPGSLDAQHPNWRRRLPLDLEDWLDDGRFRELGETLRQARGSAVSPRDAPPPVNRVAVIPRATYRLQFNRDFTFAQAQAMAPYLAELGVSHCYASSYLTARPGSGHGYDIVDHARLNPEIGDSQAYEDFDAALKANGIGQILDVVPNHMGVMGADNAWWLDVLENGPASAWGAFFDIDWDPQNPDLTGKVLLPLLGDHYGTVLNRGELRLEYDAARGEFSLFYYQHRLPVDPASYPRIIGHRCERLATALGEHSKQYGELQALLTAFGHLPARTDSDPARMAERQRDKEVHKRHLAALSDAQAAIGHHITDNLAELNGTPGQPASFDLLHELIREQGYRLAYWRVAAASRDTCDFTLNGLREALEEVVACFPVYRSYVAHGELSADDRRHIAWAIAVAKKRSPLADTGIYDFVEGVLTCDLARGRGASFRERVQAFAMKFQQVSSPVMAKGVEDTAFYRYHRLTSLNDVGGEPRRFGISVAAFHGATRARALSWPHNMLATSTHDSKRSEDVRARLNVLSEIPAAWKLMLRRWRRLNRGRKRLIDKVEAPSRNDEYLLYQTLVGTWPLTPLDDAALADYRARIDAYMIKALREAKEHSSWVQVNGEYEGAVSGFIQALLAPGEKNLFLADFVEMVRTISHHGLINALAQTLIKITSPGVPDIYQGCELWQFNLVDPDNRRPVDFEQRRHLLAETKALVEAPPEQWPDRLRPLLDDMRDGRIKLYTLWQTLALRQQWPEVFRDGSYLPLTVSGERALHACAYARRHGDHTLITLVPRLPARLLGDNPILPLGPEVWGDSVLELPVELAGTAWRNAFTGERHAAAGQLALGQLFATFPVVLLASETVD
ncbi:MAG: 4-alpha-glucanotransferase [Pseudomonadota bacterium]|nr:4-alpha-glucanotransferase [Pseudomonadota bacterium]MDP1572905.1 4-alpha-glucanotransferase [Pseudomonadota bacterium]MDP1906141.1 4-alpha-glucanotransferase [Pseudomonadota bacterium]